MKITSIKLQGFGLFDQPTEFDFKDDKINVIYGENETGKTTILKGIIATLFGLDKGRWADYKSFKPAEKYVGKLQFDDKNIQYKLTRDFETNKVHFRKKIKNDKIETLFMGKASPMGRSEQKEFYYDTLRKVIGLNNEEVFRNVNVIFQKSIESKIDKDIQHILTGALGMNYKTVLEKWMKEYFDMTKKSVWADIQHRRRDKEIEILENELLELKMKRDEAIENSMLTSEIDSKVREMESELNSLEQNVKRYRDEHEITREYIELLKKKKDDEEKILYFSESVEKYEELKKQRAEKQELIETEYKEVQNITDEDMAIIKETRGLDRELHQSRDDMVMIKGSKDPSSTKRVFLGMNLILIGVLIFILRFVFQKPILLWVGIGWGFLSMIYLIFAIMEKFKSSLHHQSQMSNKSGRINELQLKLQLLNEKVSSHSDIINRADITGYYDKYKKVKQELDQINYTLKQIGEPKEQEQKKQAADKELVSINGQLNYLEDKNPGLLTIKENLDEIFKHIEEMKQDVEEKEKRMEILKKKVYEYNKQLAGSAKDEESIASLNYKIREIEDDLSRYHNTREAYELVINTLNEAISEYQGEHINRLSKNISKQYKQLTKEKHQKVQLSEDFYPMVQEGTNKELKNLSCGAEDQLYFAVRLSILKEINDLTPLPLLLDDPFVNFDKERLEIVKEILFSTVKDNQVILLTHKKKYTEWPDINLIEV